MKTARTPCSSTRKGKRVFPGEALRQLLHYMEDSVIENAVNKELREIHRMVETVKRDPEVGGMRIRMFDDVIRLAEENARLAEEYAKLTEEYARKQEENARLAKEKFP